MLRHTGMCHPNGLVFSPILRQGPHFSQKILRRGSQFTKNCGKIEKSENPNAFAKNLSDQPFFEGEKSLEMGKGFRPQATHPVKNEFQYTPSPRLSTPFC